MVEWKKLGEVCNDVIVPMRDRPKVFDGTIPWCRIEDIEGMYFNKSLSGLMVSEKIVKQMNLKVYPAGTVICSCSATLGVCAINTQPLITNQTFIGLVCSEQIINRFLYYYMLTRKKELMSLSTTGTIPYVSREKFEKITIPIPSLEEQTRIVGILDTFTSAIDNLKEQIAQRRKQYEYYCSCFFSTEKWPENKIGELTKVFSCPRVFKDQWRDSGVPFWRSSDIMSYHNGVINPRGEVYISQSLYDDLSSKSDKIKEGDILVTGGGSIGIPYLKKDNSPLFVKDADLICIQKCISIIPKYLYHYFLSTDFKLYLKKITHDATIAHYTINQIKDTPIPLPPLSEQQRIASILDTFEASIQNLEAQLEQREKQYEYYRNKLLTFE